MQQEFCQKDHLDNTSKGSPWIHCQAHHAPVETVQRNSRTDEEAKASKQHFVHWQRYEQPASFAHSNHRIHLLHCVSITLSLPILTTTQLPACRLFCAPALPAKAKYHLTKTVRHGIHLQGNAQWIAFLLLFHLKERFSHSVRHPITLALISLFMSLPTLYYPLYAFFSLCPILCFICHFTLFLSYMHLCPPPSTPFSILKSKKPAIFHHVNKIQKLQSIIVWIAKDKQWIGYFLLLLALVCKRGHCKCWSFSIQVEFYYYKGGALPPHPHPHHQITAAAAQCD